MTTTKERIKELIEKINENTDENNSKYKELSTKEIQTLLNEIDDELVEIEDNVEKSQKEVVSKKVEELRSEVDKINKKWKWGRIKDILEEDIKSGLEDLKKEIEELEKPLQVVPFDKESNLGGLLIVPENRTKLEELEAWNKYFHGQSPEVVLRRMEGLENFFVEANSALKKTKVIDKYNNVDVLKLSESISGSAQTYMNLAKQVGDSSGLGILITPAASAAAATAGVAHGVILAGAVAGASIYETTREGLQEYALETQDDLKEVYENTRAGAQEFATHIADNTKELIGQGLKTFDFVGTLTGGISEAEIAKAKAASDAEIAKANATARAERIEDLEKQLETLRKEKDNQIKEIKEEKERDAKNFNERIQKKDDKIEKLEAKIDKLENKRDELTAQIMQVSRPNSPMPPNN